MSGVCAVLIGAVALAGCETTMDLLDRRSSRPDVVVQITREGVGPLNAATAADQAQILKVMPGYTSGTVLIAKETEAVNAVVLFRQMDGATVQMLQVVATPDGHIAEIHGVSQQVAGPAGEKPGMTFADARTDPASCRAGTGLWVGLAICKSPAADNVLLTYSFRGASAQSRTLPPPKELAAGELQRIIWTPPA